MPTYEYRCRCGNAKDITKPMSESGRAEVCTCGEQMRRIFGGVQFAFGSWKPDGSACTPENALAEARMAGMEDGDE